MNTSKRLLISVLLGLSLLSCKKVNDLGIRALGGDAIVSEQNCDILSIVRSDNTKLTFTYQNNRVEKVTGVELFNELIYSAGKLTGASLPFVKEYEVKFKLDNNNHLSEMNVSGRDGGGKLFNETSKFTYSGAGKMTNMSLKLPIFPDPVEVSLEYSGNNLSRITKKQGVNSILLLSNKSFDDKKSPFFTQGLLGELLSYFLVYNLLNGDANFSYFLSENNVTESQIINEKGTTNLNIDYQYSNGYPISADISKETNGRLKSVTETFTYNCE